VNDSYPLFENIGYGLAAALIFSLIRYFFFGRKDDLEAEKLMKKNYQGQVYFNNYTLSRINRYGSKRHRWVGT
jgi:hypothetical protein